jgi:replicative DNA helicase
VLAATGVGKTALLQNLALQAKPMTTLMFELELPLSLLYERFTSATVRQDGYRVEEYYSDGKRKDGPQFFMGHIFCCPKTGISPEEISTIINRSELKIGKRPQLVLIDYIQLMADRGGSRYERVSNIAERLRVVAKETNTIIVVASQIGRKPKGSGSENPQNDEVFLDDGKDSGSIENSSSLVLGAWRDKDDASLMYVKVLKNTKGRSGKLIACNYNGAQSLITERSSIADKDIPAYDKD